LFFIAIALSGFLPESSNSNASMRNPGSTPIERSALLSPRMKDPDYAEVERLCERHGYPAGIRTLLEKITRAVSIPGTRSVVLSGSGSRGEFVYSEQSSGVRMFSDIELCVVAEPLVSQEVARAEKRIRELEQEQLRVGDRTFHIDVSFTTPRTWRGHQRNFQSWETKQTGWVLWGEDVRDQIRADVDPRTAVQSSLNRLWHLLLYLPEGLLRGNASKTDQQVFAYVLDRAVLDFPLWLLVRKGILVSGFAGRLRYLKENSDRLDFRGVPLGDLIELIEPITRDRAAHRSESSIGEQYDRVLDWYPVMLGWSLETGTIEAFDLPRVLHSHRKEIYPALDWRRILWELGMATRLARTTSPRAAWAWLRDTKQVRITSFLWSMHRAASSAIAGNVDEAEDRLEQARVCMSELWPDDPPVEKDLSLANRWLELRRRFIAFLISYYRGLEQNRSYYRFVLEAR